MVAAFRISVVLLGLMASVGFAGAAVVTAPTGPPELLALGYNPLAPMDRDGYEKAVQGLASRDDLVPVREWPAGLPADAPVFLTQLSAPLVTLAIRGDASTGFELLADADANGRLDEPVTPLEKNGDEWIATIRVLPPPAAKAADRRAPALIELKWMQVSFQDPGERIWRLMMCRENVRRGVIELPGRKTAFAITGATGAYGREWNEVFFDLDGDGRLALDEPFSRERFTVQEERVVAGHTDYRFVVDPAGDSITLTRLKGRFEPRARRAPRFLENRMRPLHLGDAEARRATTQIPRPGIRNPGDSRRASRSRERHDLRLERGRLAASSITAPGGSSSKRQSRVRSIASGVARPLLDG